MLQSINAATFEGIGNANLFYRFHYHNGMISEWVKLVCSDFDSDMKKILKYVLRMNAQKYNEAPSSGKNEYVLQVLASDIATIEIANIETSLDW